jgi:Pup-ligase protein
VQERVFGLETEYALSFEPEGESSPADTRKIYEALSAEVARLPDVVGSGFLANGSRFYLDQGHVEWATPECRSAREAATFDAAADGLLLTRLGDAEAFLARNGHRGRVLVVKNNVDGSGHTYGCHENYMVPRKTEWLDEDDHLRLTARALVPFLVSRQVITGAGRVGFGPTTQEGSGFQLSQRADFISEAVSTNTTADRAIFCLSRWKTETLAGNEKRRLHLILGDSNLSPWATWLKLGTTGLVLRLIEELGLEEIPQLSDPVAALRTISRDPNCSVTVPLRDKRQLTAVEIQRLYWQQAASHLARGRSEEENGLLAEWGRILDALERDSRTLFGYLDWVTKKRFLDLFLEQQGLTWEQVSVGEGVFFDLVRKDIQFHELSPAGLYQRIRPNLPPSPLDPQAVARAVEEPPPFTRAWLRGALLRHESKRVGWKNWDKATLDGRDVPVPDPFSLDGPAELAALIPEDHVQHRLSLAFQSPEAPLRAWAISRLGSAALPGGSRTLRQIANDENEASAVRLAALEVLARDEAVEARETLRAVAAGGADPSVRWRAKDLLETPPPRTPHQAEANGKQPRPDEQEPARGSTPQAPSAESETAPLVQFLD